MTVLLMQHFTLPIPPDGVEDARRFYGTLLGFKEIERPQEASSHAGCWFSSGSVNLHLLGSEPFAPVTVGHPGLVIRGSRVRSLLPAPLFSLIYQGNFKASPGRLFAFLAFVSIW
ncbi:hypothetical protein [Pseudovibrio sp. W64]|uniref:hypothetical protein n=1 Tax=Pseudovibrio sp. W64 TaxID=1735583 RepID=UPI001290623C|nr:hypothetical protein [Pseudovibrio sp. W64]